MIDVSTQAFKQVQDSIFENLPPEQRSGWTERLYEAIPMGADLKAVLHQLAVRRLTRLADTTRRALESATDEHGVADAIKQVLAALDQVIVCHRAELGEADFVADWSAAKAAAWEAKAAAESAKAAARSAKAAAWAADSAAWAAWSAESAAWAAWSAESAAWAAWSAKAAESAAWAAWSAKAAESAAESESESAWSAKAAKAAESAAWQQEADDLIELLEAMA